MREEMHESIILEMLAASFAPHLLSHFFNKPHCLIYF